MSKKKAPLIKPEPVLDVFGALPQTLAPTDLVRRWDHALAYGGLIGLGAFAITNGLLASTLASNPADWWIHARGMALWDHNYRELLRSMVMLKPLIYSALSYATGLISGLWVGKEQLKPYCHMRHLSGAQLRWDAEAVDYIRHCAGALKGDSKPWAYLHPDVPIGKTTATRGFTVEGGIGSGKSVFQKQFYRQMFRAHHRCLVADFKGDMTETFYGGKHKYCRIFSPWDARSVRWNIAADINTPDRALAFANGVVDNKGGDSNPYWSLGASDIITGVLIGLMTLHPGTWTLQMASATLLLPQDELHGFLAKYRPTAAKYIADTAKSGGDMIGTLSAYARPIFDLAEAWPGASEAEPFSWLEWLTNPRIRQRQIIVQAGPDPKSTAMLMGAIFTYITNLVGNSEVLPDKELARDLCFLIDELPQWGRFPINKLIEVGRSKGAVVMIGFQARAQLRDIWGDKVAETILSSIPTKVIFWLDDGARKDVAESFGYRRVVTTLPNYNNSEGGTSSTLGIKEEARAVVDPYDIATRCGVLKGPQYQANHAVRGILSLPGFDPTILQWGGRSWARTAQGRVGAAWTRAPVKEKTWRQLHGIHARPHQDALQACRDMVALFDQHIEAIAARRAVQTELLHSLRETHLGVGDS